MLFFVNNVEFSSHRANKGEGERERKGIVIAISNECKAQAFHRALP